MILKEAEERMKLISDNTITRVFSAKYNTRYLYPYALQHVGKAYPGVRDTCYELILDSGINNEEVTNREVLERAMELNPDYIIPNDFYGDQERTRESMHEFFDLYRYSYPGLSATPFVVLQPPYADEYWEHQEFYDQFGHIALGGLQMYNSKEQVKMIRRLRSEIGYNKYIHAFGVGTSLELIRALREEPRLLDSLDMSTAETAIAKGEFPTKVVDGKWKRTDFYIPSGIDSSTVRARLSASLLYMLNYMLGTRVDDEELRMEFEENTVLGEVADIQRERETKRHKQADL